MTMTAREVIDAAIAEVRGWYPTDVFPENGKSQDCLSASMARLTCDNIEREVNTRLEALAPPADLAPVAAALEAAEQFIQNGVELGYIQMPDADCADAAHKTLPTIQTALAYCRALIAPPASSSSQTVSKVGDGEAVATVCFRGDRYAHDNMIEVQLQKAPGVDFPIGTKFYTHPAPPAAFANETALAEWLESLHECDDGSVGNRKWEPAQRAAAVIRDASLVLVHPDTMRLAEQLQIEVTTLRRATQPAPAVVASTKDESK